MEVIKDLLRPELIWFLIGLVLLIMEFAMPGLIIFFFGVGAWIVALTCLFMDISINIQLLVFIVSSVVLLIALRRWLKNVFMGHIVSKDNLQQKPADCVGEKVVVKSKITPNLPGTIELHGTDWQATADVEIEAGAVVEIIDKDNLKLNVKPI